MATRRNSRACSQCGQEVIDVVDEFTGATYPVDAESTGGLLLGEPPPGKRNALAVRAEIHQPHLPRCSSPDVLGPEEL